MSKAGRRANRARDLRLVAGRFAKAYYAHTGKEATPRRLQELTGDCSDPVELRLALGLALAMMGIYGMEAGK